MHFQGIYDLILMLFDLGLFGWELWTVEVSGLAALVSCRIHTALCTYLYFGTSLFLDKQVHSAYFDGEKPRWAFVAFILSIFVVGGRHNYLVFTLPFLTFRFT